MISIIIPVFNEAPNLEQLRERVIAAAEALERSFEVIIVNDGSTDETQTVLQRFAEEDPRIKIIEFSRNFGQTAALMAGVEHAGGDILVPMDGDLQNDPADIATLLDKLEEGYDVVSGWRKERQDKLFSRRLPSVVANRLISWMSGVRLHDYGCTLKAYRATVLKDVKLYGEMHRFIPIYSSWQGGRVCEVPVRHYPRTGGQSNYGFGRTIKVILDLLVVQFLGSYGTKPIYVFGTFGILLLLAGVGVGIWALCLKLFYGVSFIETPLPLLTVLCILLGVITVLMGLLAELLVRIYYESQDKKTFLIKSSRNLN
jgi:dolichol-phosphate mannosyltransferase